MRPAALASVALLLVVACGGAGGDTRAVVPAGAVDLTAATDPTVPILDNRFEPRIVVVTEGATITWVNEGHNEHDVIPDVEGYFDPVTPVLTPGEQASRTFADAGTFTYFCSIHGTPGRGQIGTVIVVRAGVEVAVSGE